MRNKIAIIVSIIVIVAIAAVIGFYFIQKNKAPASSEGGCCNSCGCGSPLGLGEIKEGEVVLDL